MSLFELPKVTIMIPTYNQESFIREAVESALMQTYPKLEVVVGDDCSTDSTAMIVSEMKDKRLKLVRNNKNLGRTANYRNLLYNHATGDFVINLDGDDYYTDTTFIARAVDLAVSEPDVVIVAARAMWLSGGKKNTSKIPETKIVYGLNILKKLPKYEFFFKHMATLYKRETALDLDFYRLNVISSDWESLYRLAVHGKVKYLDRIVGVWRIHNENETGIVDFQKFVANLEIWPSIYREAQRQGMNSILARVTCASCVAFFSSVYAANLSRQGNKNQMRYLYFVLKKYPASTLILLFHPFYFARILIGFGGYYRLRCGTV